MTDAVRALLLLLDDEPPVAAPAGLVRRRIRRRHVAVTSALVAAALVGTTTGVAAFALRRARPALATATVTDRGVRLRLTLEPRYVRVGDVVTARVAVTNTTAQPLTWVTDACRELAKTTVVVGTRDGDDARWTGAEAEFKRRALIGWHTGTFQPDGAPNGCAAVARYNTLGAGETRRATLRWRATVPGGGTPTGTATVTTRFSLYDGDIRAAVGGGPTVSVPIRFTGPPTVGVGDAVDVALADPEFAAWLERHPVKTWVTPMVTQSGDRWHVGLVVLRPLEVHGYVTVDPVARRVVARTLP